MIGSNVTLSTSGSDIRGDISGTLHIGSGGTLNTASTEAILSGTGTLNINSGGAMIIGSASGITSSGATGNVQTTTRTFNTAGNYAIYQRDRGQYRYRPANNRQYFNHCINRYYSNTLHQTLP